MERNLLFDTLFSSSSSPSSSTDASSNASDVSPLPTAATVAPATIQMVNIRAHVPVTLDMANDSNYSEWRLFFDMVFAKFGLCHHVSTRTSRRRRSPDCIMNDATVKTWIYNTCTRALQRMVMQPNKIAYDVWHAVKGLFCDNQATRAVYIEAEFRSLLQGDSSITEYCSRLKTLADNLRDVGQPVQKANQVLNMLRGLNPKYGHAISSITSKDPLPTFLQARSILLLEEFREVQKAKSIAAQAMFAGHGSPAGGPPAPPPHISASGAHYGGGRGRSKNNHRGKMRRNPGGAAGAGVSGGSGSDGQGPIGSGSYDC